MDLHGAQVLPAVKGAAGDREAAGGRAGVAAGDDQRDTGIDGGQSLRAAGFLQQCEPVRGDGEVGTTGAAIRRWMCSMASSRRSSLSTSSQRPAARAARRVRNPALTARSIPTVWMRVVATSLTASARIWSSLPTWPSVT